VKIRDARAEDAAGVRAVLGEAFAGQDFRFDLEGPSVVTKVAEEAGEIVGFYLGRLVRVRATLVTGTLGVLRSHRGRGLSVKLMQAVLEGGKRAGMRRSYTQVHEDNVACVRTCLRCGYAIVGGELELARSPRSRAPAGRGALPTDAAAIARLVHAAAPPSLGAQWLDDDLRRFSVHPSGRLGLARAWIRGERHRLDADRQAVIRVGPAYGFEDLTLLRVHPSSRGASRGRAEDALLPFATARALHPEGDAPGLAAFERHGFSVERRLLSFDQRL